MQRAQLGSYEDLAQMCVCFFPVGHHLNRGNETDLKVMTVMHSYAVKNLQQVESTQPRAANSMYSNVFQ